MFGLGLDSKAIVLKHWYVLMPEYQASTGEFYEAVEKSLTDQEVPGLETSRILFPEGGFLSAHREYLRMRRERLVFDVCSTAFGTSWFFSCRYAFIPLRLRLWEILAIPAILFLLWLLHFAVFGLFWGSIVCGVSVVGFLYLLNILLMMGLFDLDAMVMKVPVLGPFYEIFIRRDTYYREDTRLMYCDLVDQIVKSKVVEFSGAKDLSEVPIKEDPSPPPPGGFLGFVFGGLHQLFGRMLSGLRKL